MEDIELLSEDDRYELCNSLDIELYEIVQEENEDNDID